MYHKTKLHIPLYYQPFCKHHEGSTDNSVIFEAQVHPSVGVCKRVVALGIGNLGCSTLFR